MDVNKFGNVQDNRARRRSRRLEKTSASVQEQRPLIFVTTNDPRDTKNPAIQRVIRKHVMRDIGQARKWSANYGKQNLLQIPAFLYAPEEDPNFSPEVTYNERVLPGRLPLSGTIQSRYIPYSPDAKINQSSIPISASSRAEKPSYLDYMYNPNPLGSPSTAFSDPFLSYPIQMDSRAHWLIIHIFDDRYANFQPFRDIWFPLALSDAGAFHQLLSNSALHISSVRTINREKEALEALSHHSSALASVQARITNPSVALSDGIIASIIGFICHDHMTENYDTWHMHINGLKKIILLRGGLEAINNRQLRLLLMWVDVSGTCAQDIVPIFPLPHSLLPRLPFSDSACNASPLVKNVCNRWRMIQPQTSAISFIFEDLSIISSYMDMESRVHPTRIWTYYGFIGYWIMPLIHRLISLQADPHSMENKPYSMSEGAWRLGIILFLAEIRRKSGVAPVLSHRHMKNLKEEIDYFTFTSNGGDSFTSFWELKLWVLCYASIEASNDILQREWFVARLAAVVSESCGGSWAKAERCLRGLPWIDAVYSGKLKELQRDVTSQILLCSQNIESEGDDMAFSGAV